MDKEELQGAVSEAQSVEPSTSHQSLIDRLKCTNRSDLSKKRKIEKPLQVNKKHKFGATNHSGPVGISPSVRVKEFPGEYLILKKRLTLLRHLPRRART